MVDTRLVLDVQGIGGLGRRGIRGDEGYLEEYWTVRKDLNYYVR